MKSRTSFFDKTVLKKDITRFAPLWGLYLIGGLLVVLSFYTNSSGWTYYRAQDLNTSIGPLSVVSICYAMLAAQLLFGDLFNTRLCNALHAMPLRREGWFFTHVTAGLLFSIVPNTIICLLISLALGEWWYTALLLLLGMTLHYIFFFALAVFCMLLTGNRFAATAVYAICNFFSLIVMWFCSTVFGPLMYGVVIRTDAFAPYCPVVNLCTFKDFFRIEHDPTCPCVVDDEFFVREIYNSHLHTWQGLGENWIYLAILAALGIAIGAAALALYRKRHLESAGDFVAFKAARPVFTVIYTLCVGAVLQIIGNLFETPIYFFLAVGLVVGYFTAQMLLNRTAKVFKKKNWLGAALLLVLVFGGVGLCKVDAFGIVSWTPSANQVVSVKVADSRVSEFTAYNTDAEFTDKKNIETLISIHKLLYAEGPTESRGEYDELQNVTLCYTLKDGREIYRQYRATEGGNAEKALNQLVFKTPSFVLRAETLEDLLGKTDSVYVNDISISSQQMEDLLQALWADLEAGNLQHDGKWESGHVGYVQIQYKTGEYLYQDIFESNTNTAKWIKESLLNDLSAADLQKHVSWFFINGKELTMDMPGFDEFCYLFALDNQNGLILEGMHAFGLLLEINFYNGLAAQFTVTKEATNCYPWIVDYLEME